MATPIPTYVVRSSHVRESRERLVPRIRMLVGGAGPVLCKKKGEGFRGCKTCIFAVYLTESNRRTKPKLEDRSQSEIPYTYY